jgi:predicted ester cyclase
VEVAMTAIPKASVEDRVQWEVSQAEYDRIREVFLHHCDRELAGDIDGVLETLTPDCVYELTQTGQRWDGHAGARRFYEELLGAFPDNSWEIHDVVIGPQGVMSNVTMTAHQAAPFAGVNDVGQEVHWRLNNMFPWDPQAQQFRGETLYFFRPEAEYFVPK